MAERSEALDEVRKLLTTTSVLRAGSSVDGSEGAAVEPFPFLSLPPMVGLHIKRRAPRRLLTERFTHPA
jgi:hypothetical protein